LFALSVAALIGACDTIPADKFREADQARQAAQEKVRQIEAQVADEQKTVRNLQEQLASARGIDTETLAQLAAPVRLQFASQSGAYDTDGKTGDDGIVLYVQPVDSDGDVIKAAGSMRVTLLDLSDPTQPKVISPYEFDVPNTRKLWYGRLMTSHFTVRCPWPPNGVPKVNQVTAVAEFKDLLTGRVLTAQQAFPVTPPPVLTATRPK
jgi:hypothetical protein